MRTLGVQPLATAANATQDGPTAKTKAKTKMMKTFVVLLLSAAAVACSSKKPSTTPAQPMESGATGGAAYGGAAYAGGAHKAPPPATDAPNPAAPK